MKLRHWSVILMAICFLPSILCAQQGPDLFFGAIDRSTPNVGLKLNPSQLTDEVKNRLDGLAPGQAVWVSDGNSISSGEFESLEKNEKWAMYSGGLVLYAKLTRPATAGYILLSLKPLSEQKWKQFSPSDVQKSVIAAQIGKEVARISWSGVNPAKSEPLIIAQYETGTEAEFTEYETLIFRAEGKTNWEKVSSFLNDGGMSTPFFDVDGDGIPEFAGPTGYKSMVLRKVVPEVQDLVVNLSGV